MRGEISIKGHRDGATHGNSEVCDDPVVAVFGEDADERAFFYAEGL
jgi:hypothetical protein